MDPKKLPAVNKKLNNVSNAVFPYWWAFQGEHSASEKDMDRKMVPFFGNDMATFTKMGMDATSYIKRCNKCLDYIRRELGDCRLCYKPHPADKEERVALNLDGFEMLEGDTNAEMFLFQNRDNIKAVFSVGSAAAYSAYAMGLNAHVFYRCFKDIYDEEFIRPLDEFYYNMPRPFFIKDFSEKRVDNAQILKKDEPLELFFRQILNENGGRIWLIALTIEYIVLLIALAKLIKNLAPSRKIGLIVSRHRYWDAVNADYFKKYFDEIIVWPRINYSLRPAKLLQAMRMAREIKKFEISEGDALISITQNSFVENCLNSYNNKNLKIGLIATKDFNLFYNSQNSVYTQNNDFRFSKASWFFNKIFEPLLGLNRSLFMFYGRGKGSFIVRYQKPLNEVFDQIVVLRAPIHK